MEKMDERRLINAVQDATKSLKEMERSLTKMLHSANRLRLTDSIPQRSREMLHGEIPVLFDVKNPSLEGKAAVLLHEDGQVEISILMCKRDSNRIVQDFGKDYKFDTFVLSDVMLEPELEPE